MLPGKTYTVDEVLRIARKRVWVVLVPVAVVSAATAVVARRIPDVYRSDATIVVVPQRIPEAYVKSTVTMRIEDRLQAIKAQILSRTQLEETIKTFNLYAKERKSGALMEDIVRRMQSEVTITPARQGEVFSIGYIGQDPKLVTRVTEYLTTSFINQSLKDRSSLADGTSQFLDTQLADAKRQLIEQEEKLRLYNLKHAGELPTQQTANLTAIANIQMQIQATGVQIADLHDRRRQLQKQLQDEQVMSQLITVDTSATTGTPLAPTPASSAAQRLNFEETRLAALLAQKLTEEHPEVRQLRRSIEDLKKEVDAEALRQPLSKSPTKAITPAQYTQQRRIEDLKEDLANVTRQITDREAEVARLRGESAKYQHKADMAPTRATELVELTRDYAALTGQYSGLLTKRNESQIAANLEARQIGEQFRLLDPARLPEKPTLPNRPMINFMGMAAGLGLGLALIGLLEYRDSSFRTDTEVTTVLTLPVLAVVPLMQSDEDRNRATRRRLFMGVGLGSTVLGCLAVLVYTFVR
jgi:polysaccharide chain length determinant protein (PEP-CTERM system associated)